MTLNTRFCVCRCNDLVLLEEFHLNFGVFFESSKNFFYETDFQVHLTPVKGMAKEKSFFWLLLSPDSSII